MQKLQRLHWLLSLSLPFLFGCAAAVPWITPDAQGRGERPVGRSAFAVDHPVFTVDSGTIAGRVTPVSKKKTKLERRLEKLTKNLKYKDDVVRTHAAFWLGEMRGDGVAAVPDLVDSMLHDESRWVRRASAKALGKIGSGEAIRPLSLAVKDRDKWVAHSAANALRQFRSAEARRALDSYRGV